MGGRLGTLYLSLTACSFLEIIQCYCNCIIHRIRAICTLKPIGNSDRASRWHIRCSGVFPSWARLVCADYSKRASSEFQLRSVIAQIHGTAECEIGNTLIARPFGYAQVSFREAGNFMVPSKLLATFGDDH